MSMFSFNDHVPRHCAIWKIHRKRFLSDNSGGFFRRHQSEIRRSNYWGQWVNPTVLLNPPQQVLRKRLKPSWTNCINSWMLKNMLVVICHKLDFIRKWYEWFSHQRTFFNSSFYLQNYKHSTRIRAAIWILEKYIYSYACWSEPVGVPFVENFFG